MEGRKRWRFGRGAVIGAALVVLVGGGAGVAFATDSTWFADPKGTADSKPVAVDREAESRSPDPMASGAHTAPKPVTPPKAPQPSTSPKPPMPAAKCVPTPKPVQPRQRDRFVPGIVIPFNGQQTVSVCITPVRSDVPAKVLTFNQAAKVIEAIQDLKLATQPNQPCTREFRGHFQVVVQATNRTYVFNGEGHGCGYVTYSGATFTGGKAVYSLIAQYMRS